MCSTTGGAADSLGNESTLIGIVLIKMFYAVICDHYGMTKKKKNKKNNQMLENTYLLKSV